MHKFGQVSFNFPERASLVNVKQKIVGVIVLVSLAGGVWWFFPEDPEAEVRDAHQEFARLLSKPQGEASAIMLLNSQILQKMFADNCVITGEAERFAGNYTPQEITGIIMQVRQIFSSVDLSFQDLVIEFPTDIEATASFTARMITQGRTEEIIEMREVVSRMRKIDGDWRFSAFNLAKVFDNQ
jgi:hypothetical protein